VPHKRISLPGTYCFLSSLLFNLFDLSTHAHCLLLNIEQICHEFERFSKYLPELRVAVFYGGVHIKNHKDLLKNECPHIVVGTPGRILALARDKDLPLKNVRHFILDECDKMLESLGRVLFLADSYTCYSSFNLMVSSPIIHLCHSIRFSE
jgi:hypothetical protein